MSASFETNIERLLENAATLSKALREDQKLELESTAKRLTSPGKGILAADESVSTIGKRLISAGLKNDEETRRNYREILFANESLGEFLGGAILNIETVFQSDSNGEPLIGVLQSKGIAVGVKVDLGLRFIERDGIKSNETYTTGLVDLLDRSILLKEAGADFVKWRAVLRLDKQAQYPTEEALQLNAAQLAFYAATTGLLPIVEPELLIEGTHSAAEFAEATEVVLGEVFAALAKAHVHLEGTLLKPQMVMAGINAPVRHSREELVQLTLQALRRRVPPAVPGIVFLSGGQSEEEATENLNAIARAAGVGPHGLLDQMTKYPWSLSFSYGRSLQASVLHVWAKGDGRAAAVAMAGALAQVNSEAQQGMYAGRHPSVMGSKNLHDPNRGWQLPNGMSCNGSVGVMM